MHRQCAWCGRNLDDPSIPLVGDNEVSHGICSDCYDELSTGTGIPVAEFVASLPEPVLLLDADHTIGMVNDAALRLLGAEDGELFGERTGTVFDCENAHLPGGCGRTIHCSGCTIRQAVAHTALTGEARVNIPATLKVVQDPGLEDVELVISTARVGERILLRIDAFQG